jgi:transposase-like protein
MHDHELHELRRELARTPTGRGIYYPDALRERVRVWAYQRREQGAPWPMIAAELGVNNSTLRRWVQAEGRHRRKHERPSTALVPVEIMDISSASSAHEASATTTEVRICLVSPGGFRIEGLTLDEAIAALQRLG